MARKKKTNSHWLDPIADQVEHHVANHKAPGSRIVCASGISPSGPIHLGNLREAMTTHLVVERLRDRGHDAVHIHSWDDFDRLRKVPAGYPDWLEDHIGRPLCDVPDPHGEYDSWATRHIATFTDAIRRIGIVPTPLRQSELYRAGTYREQIHLAMLKREEIFDVLARFQTESRQELPREERRRRFWPYRVYCPDCGKDTTQVTGYDEPTQCVYYTCACDPKERTTCLADEIIGKLIWKVDWPMRWAHEKVDFEPGGEDHSSPGSSFDVGQDIVKLFAWDAPAYEGYGFVGLAGTDKMSSSAGYAPTPAFALRFIEPAVLRFMYLRRPAKTKFTIEFGSEIWRQYDEWDAFRRKVEAQDEPTAVDEVTLRHTLHSSFAPVHLPEITVGFRILTSAADITAGNARQIARIVRDHLGDDAPTDDATLLAAVEPRLDCAQGWVDNCMPESDRVVVREAFSPEAWEALADTERQAVRMLVDEMASEWGLVKLTGLLYGIPKEMGGLSRDDKPTPEVKQAQRAFFVALYELLLGGDTGPRLPTLLLSLGQERVRALLEAPAA